VVQRKKNLTIQVPGQQKRNSCLSCEFSGAERNRGNTCATKVPLLPWRFREEIKQPNYKLKKNINGKDLLIVRPKMSLENFMKKNEKAEMPPFQMRSILLNFIQRANAVSYKQMGYKLD